MKRINRIQRRKRKRRREWYKVRRRGEIGVKGG